jgi:hypothetical protein
MPSTPEHTPEPPRLPADAVRCARCNAWMIWAVTEAGRPQPLDALPSTQGNTAVYVDATGRRRARGLTLDRPNAEAYEHLHMPHHATCTDPPPRRRTGGTSRGRRPIRRRSDWRNSR